MAKVTANFNVQCNNITLKARTPENHSACFPEARVNYTDKAYVKQLDCLPLS